MSDSRPTVSVLMPSYNHERYLSAAVESVLNQTFSDLELIVVDDGSRDGSVEILARFSREDSRVRALFHEVNMGISRTMNDALDAATGRYICLTASDDMWTDRNLEAKLEVIDADPDLFVWSDADMIDENGRSLGETFTHRYIGSTGKKKEGDVFLDLVTGNYINALGAIVAREKFDGLRFDESIPYLNDFLVMLELSRRCEFRFMDEPLVRYRVHEAGTVQSNRDVWDRDIATVNLLLLHRYYEELPVEKRAALFSNAGEAFFRLGQMPNARRFMRHAVECDGRDLSLRVRSLELEHGVRFPDRWRLHMNNYEGPTGSDHRKLFDEATSLSVAGRWDEALDRIDTLLTKGASLELLMKKADMLASAGDHRHAVELYDKVLELDGDEVRALVNKGVMLGVIGEPEAGLLSLERACFLAPGDADAWFNRGSCEESLSSPEEALESYARAIDISAMDYNALGRTGVLKAIAGDFEVAVSCFEKTTEVMPDNTGNIESLAGCLRAAGCAKEALERYDNALGIEPGDCSLSLLRAGCLEALGRSEEAVAAYHEIADRAGDEDAVLAEARLLSEGGDSGRSLELFMELLERDDQDVDALCGADEALSVLGKPDEAAEYFEKAMAIDPWDSTISRNRSEIKKKTDSGKRSLLRRTFGR